MKTLLRKAQILAMGGPYGEDPFEGDLLVEDERIAAIGADLGEIRDARVIEGRDRLVMPGLVNAHLHSSEQFFKGRYERMPLEVWLLYADPPTLSLERIGAVFSAYEAAGIRANVSNSIINIAPLDALPFAREMVPPDLQRALDAGERVTGGVYADYCGKVFSTFHGRAGRLRYMISPSAPQRCTMDLLEACAALAKTHAVPFHTHVLETKTQAVTGPEIFGVLPHSLSQ
jgi:5-methylthioadenosine/S-adenosylhomocysteine deaminase